MQTLGRLSPVHGIAIQYTQSGRRRGCGGQALDMAVGCVVFGSHSLSTTVASECLGIHVRRLLCFLPRRTGGDCCGCLVFATYDDDTAHPTRTIELSSQL